MKQSLTAPKSADGHNVVNTASVRLKKRMGLTLIEVLIATTLTLLMMLALAQGFKTLSDTVSAGRSRLTLSDQLRGISSLIRNDLEGLTVDSSNPQSSISGNGYFKYTTVRYRISQRRCSTIFPSEPLRNGSAQIDGATLMTS